MTSTPSLKPVAPSDLRTLAAACDMVVLRALELVGKRVARDERSRHGALRRSGKEWHEAHTLWTPEPHQVDAALAGAWALLPRLSSEHGCCGLADPALVLILDGYVRELVASSRPHEYANLQRRLEDATV
jgi:hypothetical protein